MTDHGAAPLPDLRAIAEELLAEAFVGGRRRIVAVGWATVDLDRAADQFRSRWPTFRFEDAAPVDPLLGAHLRLARTDPSASGSDPIALVLLEPSTEGRVAASLARHGEGPAAVWVAADGSPEDRPAPRTSVPADGPFGPERLLLGGSVAGPHVLLLDGPAGTIDR